MIIVIAMVTVFVLMLDMIYCYQKMPSQGPTWKVVCGLPPWGKLDEQQHFCRHFHSAKKIYAEKILYAEER